MGGRGGGGGVGDVGLKKKLKEERVQEEREPKIKRGKDLGKRELERETDMSKPSGR